MEPAAAKPAPCKSGVFSLPAFFEALFICLLGSLAEAAVHLYGRLRKSGHVHPNRHRSLTAMEINPIRELKRTGALGLVEPT